MTSSAEQYPVIVPDAVMVGDKRLTRPATEHEQAVLDEVFESFSDVLYQACAARGVNLYQFLPIKHRAVVTPDELEQRTNSGIGTD